MTYQQMLDTIPKGRACQPGARCQGCYDFYARHIEYVSNHTPGMTSTTKEQVLSWLLKQPADRLETISVPELYQQEHQP